MKPGDKITVVSVFPGSGDGTQAHRATCESVDAALGFRFRARGGWQGVRTQARDGDLVLEGIGWCTGWDGPAVDALLAAHALS